MMRRRPIMCDRSGSAAVEMALITPLLLVILFGSVEVGNFFYNEHRLTKAVRDGARYAARQSFTNYSGCTGTAAAVPTALLDSTKLIVRKGMLDSSEPDLLANWANGSTIFTVMMQCSTAAGGTTLGGIYNGNNVGTAGFAPRVIVTASLPYQPILGAFGFTGSGVFLNAAQQSAVTGL